MHAAHAPVGDRHHDDDNCHEVDPQRAPLRAHILASINPFQSSIDGATSRRHKRSRREYEGREQDRGKRDDRDRRSELSDAETRQGSRTRETDDETNLAADDTLRPRKSRIRFKSRRDTEKKEREDKNERRHKDYDDRDSRGRVRESREPESRHRSRDDKDDDDDDGGDEERRQASRDNDDGHQARDQDDRQGDRDGRRDGSRDGTTRGHSRHSRDDRHRHHHRRHHHHHHHHHHHRRKKRHRSPSEHVEEEDPYAEPPLDPDAAFRQSLFDAMADDEGAAYWEGVYGQPVHEYVDDYKRERQTRGGGEASGEAASQGGVDSMNDDEYADYVRRRMWERSHEGMRELKEKRDREEQQKKAQREAAQREEERQRQRQERFDRDRRYYEGASSSSRGRGGGGGGGSSRQGTASYWADVEASLRRGARRKQRKAWDERWSGYVARWAAWEKEPTTGGIAWPVPVVAEADEAAGGDTVMVGDDGERADERADERSEERKNGRDSNERSEEKKNGGGSDERSEERKYEKRNEEIRSEAYLKDVQEFFLGQESSAAAAAAAVAARLREERVRWHPDKIQQKLGGSVDGSTMKAVTAIFQVVDRLWREARAKHH